MNYGARLKELRTNAGLSANALAKKVDLDPTTLYKIESNSAKPSLDSLERICTALNITLAEFFSEDKPHLATLAENIKSLTGNTGKASERLINKLQDPITLNYIVNHELPKIRATAVEQYGENAKSVQLIDAAANGTPDEQRQLILSISEDIEQNPDGTWNLILKGSKNSETDTIVEQFNSLSDHDRQLVRLILEHLRKK